MSSPLRSIEHQGPKRPIRAASESLRGALCLLTLLAGLGTASAAPSEDPAPPERTGAPEGKPLPVPRPLLPIRPIWRVDLQVAANWLRGNSLSIGANGLGMVNVRQGNNEVDLKGQVAYARVGLQEPGGPVVATATAALNWWWRLRYDRHFRGANSIYGAASMDGNFRAGIAYRVDPLAGYSRVLWRAPRHLLIGEVGYVYTYERRVYGIIPDDVQFHSARASVQYLFQISPQVTLLQWAEAFWALNYTRRVRVISFTSLSTSIWKHVTLRLSFLLRYNSDPPPRPLNQPPGSRFEPLDTLLEGAIGVVFS